MRHSEKGRVISLENKDGDKDNSRRYRLAMHSLYLIAVISIIATSTMAYSIVIDKQPAQWGALITAVSVGIVSVLGSYYGSAFGDRKLLKDLNI